MQYILMGLDTELGNEEKSYGILGTINYFNMDYRLGDNIVSN